MKYVATLSLIAVSTMLAAPNAFALSAPGISRTITIGGSAVVHQTAGRNHRMRGCKFSHGKLVCGGHRKSRGDHGRNRDRGHRGDRH